MLMSSACSATTRFKRAFSASSAFEPLCLVLLQRAVLQPPPIERLRSEI